VTMGIKPVHHHNEFNLALPLSSREWAGPRSMAFLYCTVSVLYEGGYGGGETGMSACLCVCLSVCGGIGRDLGIGDERIIRRWLYVAGWVCVRMTRCRVSGKKAYSVGRQSRCPLLPNIHLTDAQQPRGNREFNSHTILVPPHHHTSHTCTHAQHSARGRQLTCAPSLCLPNKHTVYPLPDIAPIQHLSVSRIAETGSSFTPIGAV
jgi:hypothetical protein